MGAYRAFRDADATMLEINPLVLMHDERVVALDAKMIIDDNALFRQRAIEGMRDPSQDDPREAQAAEHSLNYVGLDGTIGCIVNGAGLAMATMDVIKYAGGEPANFLDVGGGASPERVATAFRLVLSDNRVQSILVNIFAGINRCDWVAEGRRTGGTPDQDHRPAHRAAGWHQRRRRPPDTRGKRVAADYRGNLVRSGREGSQSGEGAAPVKHTTTHLLRPSTDRLQGTAS